MTVNDDLLSRAIQHQIYVERYGRGLADKIVRLLNSADKDIVETLAKRLIDIDKRGYDLGPATTKRLEDLLADIRAINEGVYQKVADGLTVELEGLAQHSADTAADGLKAAIPISTTIATPAASYLKHLVEVAPLSGTQLKPWVDRLSASRIGRIEDTIRTGLVTGKTTDQMVRDIRGPGGVFEGSRKSAQTMVLTSVAGIQNSARDAVYQRNAHLIKGVRYVSVLDTRTTSICQSRDGQFFPLDKPRPALPAHPRCRSAYAPVTRSVDEMGNVTEAEGSRYRASMDGRVPGKTTYGDWLEKQPADRQDSILGAEKAKLFRDGKVKFADLYRDDGTYKSLEELRRAEGQAASRPATPSTSKPAPEPVRPRFTSPINRDVNDATIKVEKRNVIQKELTARLKDNAADSRYDAVPEFRGVKVDQFGKASFPTGFSDANASVIKALMPELDAMADAFNIPRLRGVRQVTGPVANMGDGILGLNPHYFNGFASKVAGGGDTVAAAKKRDELGAQLTGLKKELEDVRAKMKVARDAGDRDLALDLYAREHELIREYNGLIKPFNKAAKEAKSAARGADETVTAWKPGDDPKGMPQVTTDYFTGIDRARDVLFHEFGHHVHQMYGKTQRRSRTYKPPVEEEIDRLFSRKYLGLSDATTAARARQVSKYAQTNSKEWFAENFALYMMGRQDIVDQDVKDIIERLLDEQSR